LVGNFNKCGRPHVQSDQIDRTTELLIQSLKDLSEFGGFQRIMAGVVVANRKELLLHQAVQIARRALTGSCALVLPQPPGAAGHTLG
jgi:hypothetical protein